MSGIWRPSVTGPATSSDPSSLPPRRLIVLFGAGVRRDGEPSPALRRRIFYAAGAAAADPAADLFLTGARGRYGPSEASVMYRALSTTINPLRLHLDEESTDTLTQVRAAAAFARAGNYTEIAIATDRYHQPRVRILFAMERLASHPVTFARDLRPTLKRYRLKMRLREAAAIPYDIIAALFTRRR